MLKEIHENFVGVLSLVIVSIAIFSLVKLSSHAGASPNSPTPIQVTDPGGSDHYLYAAFYSVKGGWTSVLGLNNSQNHELNARVTLFNKHGHALSTSEMEIKLGPHQNHGFNIADWIGNRVGFDEGSLVVFFHGPSMAMGAQEIVTDAEHSLNFEVHLSEYDDFMSSRVEGLWWALDGQSEAKVFVTNTRATNTSVTPVFYVRGVAHQGESINLDGHETTMIDIEQSLEKLHVSGDVNVGGISLNYTNSPGSIAVVGVVANKHRGFSTTMRFIDQASQQTTTLHGASLPIGRPDVNSGFPSSARLTPHVIVRNNTEQPVEVKPRIRYTLSDQANTIRLDTVVLAAREVRELDLSEAINAIGNHPITDSGIEIKHSGQAGAVMAYAASVDQSGTMVLDVPIKDPKNMMFKGGSYPWNIDGDNRAVLHVKSVDAPGDGRKREVMAKLYFDGGEYNLPLQVIEAGQTTEIDIKKLRDDQVQDTLGSVIPLNVTGGQLNWFGRAKQGEFIGRLVQYNPVTGMSASFSCVTGCNCEPTWIDSWLEPAFFSGVVDDSFQIIGWELDQDCFGNDYGPYFAINTHFSSSNTSVATVQGSQVTFVGSGTAQISGHWDAYTVTEGDCDPELGCGHGRNICPYVRAPNPVPTQVTVRPTVSNISPNKGLIGQPISVTVSGTGFVAGSTLSIDSGTLNNVTFQSSTTITANYTSNNNASGGNHRVTVTSNGRTSTDNVNFYVQIPTTLTVLSVTNLADGTGSQSGCPSGSYGIKIAISYQVKDQAGGSIATNDMEPQETVTNEVLNGTPLGDPVPTFSDIGPSRITGTTQFTNTSGQFLDAPYGICEPFSISSYTFTQLIRVLASNQNPYVLRTNNITVTGATAGHGTISNGGDISSSRP